MPYSNPDAGLVIPSIDPAMPMGAMLAGDASHGSSGLCCQTWVARVIRYLPGLLAIAAALVAATGCDACNSVFHPRSREPEFTVGPGNMVELRARIPEHLQTHCDVCPFWCTQLDLRPVPGAVLVAEYRRSATLYGDDDRQKHYEGWQSLESRSESVRDGVKKSKNGM